jgi:hypothetical protein
MPSTHFTLAFIAFPLSEPFLSRPPAPSGTAVAVAPARLPSLPLVFAAPRDDCRAVSARQGAIQPAIAVALALCIAPCQYHGTFAVAEPSFSSRGPFLHPPPMAESSSAIPSGRAFFAPATRAGSRPRFDIRGANVLLSNALLI